MRSPFKKKGRTDGTDEALTDPDGDEMAAFIVDASSLAKKQRWKLWSKKQAEDRYGEKPKRTKEKLPRSQRDSAGRGASKRTVVLLDGDRTVLVTAKGRTILSAEETKHESAEAAAASARKAAGRSFVVWHSERQSFTLSDPPEMELHAKAEPVWLLKVQESIFKRSEPAACIPAADGRRGWLALTSPNRPKWADGGAVPGGFAVGKEDGAWLRVGWDVAEISLVVDEAVVGWEHLGDGITALERQLEAMVPTGRRGADNQRAMTSEYHKRLLESVDAALALWQRQGLSARRIWVHGPGVEAPQELSQSLSKGTGLSVSVPEFGGWEHPPANHSWLTSAIAAMEGDLPVWRSADSIRNAQRRKKMMMRVGAAAAAALVLGGMWYLSASEGSKISERISAAEAKEAAAQARIAENQALVESESESEAGRQLAAMTGMEAALGRAQGLKTVDGAVPDEARAASLFSDLAEWEALFEFWELWFYAPKGQSNLYEPTDGSIAVDSPLNFSLSGGEWRFSFPGSGKSVEGNLILRELLDMWAVAVWGDCATTVGGPTALVNSDGLSDLNVTIEPVQACLLQRLSEMDAADEVGDQG